MLKKSSLDFLKELKNNNNKDWFHSHAQQYKLYKEDYHQLIERILTKLMKEDDTLQPLEVKNCMFRINRDIRFSKDKSPYKTHMSMWFTRNKFEKNFPGYYLHIDGNQSFVAGGLWGPESSQLALIRKELAFFYDDLEAILSEKSFKKHYNGLDVDPKMMLKTIPRGFEKDHPAGEWLKYKSFTCSSYFDEKAAFEPNFVDEVVKKMKVLKPLNDFLHRALTEN